MSSVQDNSLTITSISGGKSSAWMALNYPTDLYIFACVLIEDPECAPKDKALIKYCQDKIPSFIASAEHDLTLLNLMKLEQELGKEITWVHGVTFDTLLDNKTKNFRGGKPTYLPSYARRYCTENMKILPIFEYCYLYLGASEEIVLKMNIGIRYDEFKRAKNISDNNELGFKYPMSTSLKGAKQNKWDYIHWREIDFPMLKDKITQFDIYKYWSERHNYEWPLTSNCAGCFHKNPELINLQWRYDLARMRWFARQETIGKGTWRQEGTYEQFRDMPFTTDMFNAQELSMSMNCSCTD